MSNSYLRFSRRVGNIKIAGLILGLGVLIAAGLLFYGHTINSDSNQLAMIGGVEFDLADDSAVAVVNGQDITRGRLNLQLSQLAANPQTQMQMPDPSQTEDWNIFTREVLDNLIGEVLIVQAAEQANLEATEAEVDEWYQMIAGSFPTEADLDDHLAELNMTRQRLRADIADQILIEKYIEVSGTMADLPTVTEAQIQDFYDQYLADDPAAPALAEVADQIEGQLVQEQMGDVWSEIIGELRAEAEIEILL